MKSFKKRWKNIIFSLSICAPFFILTLLTHLALLVNKGAGTVWTFHLKRIFFLYCTYVTLSSMYTVESHSNGPMKIIHLAVKYVWLSFKTNNNLTLTFLSYSTLGSQIKDLQNSTVFFLRVESAWGKGAYRNIVHARKKMVHIHFFSFYFFSFENVDFFSWRKLKIGWNYAIFKRK